MQQKAVSSTRSTRRDSHVSSEEYDISSLGTVERLIFSQAVWEFGTGAWPDISRLLARHPLISRPENFFTSQSCDAIYASLMDEAELDRDEATTAVHAPYHLKLAQKYYQARVLELRELISADEEKFQAIVAEIEDIRNRKWDDMITVQLTTGVPIDQQITVEEILESAETSTAASGQDTVQESKLCPMVELNVAPVDVKNDVTIPETTLLDESEPVVVEEVVEDSVKSVQAAYVEQAQMDAPQNNATVEEAVLFGGQEIPFTDASLAEHTEVAVDTTPAMAEMVHDYVVLSNLEDKPEWPSDNEHEKRVEVTEEQPSRRSTRSSAPTSTASSTGPSVVQDIGSKRGKRQQPTRSEEAPSFEPNATIMALQEDKDTNTPRTSAAPTEEDESATQRREGKRKASEVEGLLSDSPHDRKRAREDSELMDEYDNVPIPGPLRRRLSRHQTAVDQAAIKKFQSVIGLVHSQISQHRNGNIFHNPIKNSEAPDYHEIVLRPMDLKTIKTRIKEGAIANSFEFQRDIYLMFANAMMYNRPTSDIYNMAEEMMLESEGHINTYRQTEGFVRGTQR